MSDDATGSTIEDRSGSELERLRERAAKAERELEAIRAVRRTPGKPAFATHRYAMCRCGVIECYAVGRTLKGRQGRHSAARDPGRLENQACKGCGKKLGRWAHARAKRAYPFLHERREAVRAWREQQRAQAALARHVRTVEVSMGSGQSSRRTPEMPVSRTSAGALARGASSPPLQTARRNHTILRNARSQGWNV